MRWEIWRSNLPTGTAEPVDWEADYFHSRAELLFFLTQHFSSSVVSATLVPGQIVYFIHYTFYSLNTLYISYIIHFIHFIHFTFYTMYVLYSVREAAFISDHARMQKLYLKVIIMQKPNFKVIISTSIWVSARTFSPLTMASFIFLQLSTIDWIVNNASLNERTVSISN